MELFSGNSSGGGSTSMDPITALITGGASLLGNIFGGAQRAQTASAERKMQERIAQEQLQYQREAGMLGFEAGIEEQRRRNQEAAYRAAKLEDVVGMLEGLQMPQFERVTPTSVTAERVATPGAIEAERVAATEIAEGPDVAAMREIAAQLQGQEGALDLRRAAMRELEGGTEALNAALAAQGIRGSGFGASRLTGMTGDVLANLSRDISNQRMQALMGAANIYQGAGGLETTRMTANQEALMRAALANQQAGLSAATATAELGQRTDLANQAAMMEAQRANQQAALTAAGLNQEQIQAISQFGLARAGAIGGIYGDEAFGANAPLDLSGQEQMLADYRRRWGIDGSVV